LPLRHVILSALLLGLGLLAAAGLCGGQSFHPPGAWLPGQQPAAPADAVRGAGKPAPPPDGGVIAASREQSLPRLPDDGLSAAPAGRPPAAPALGGVSFQPAAAPAAGGPGAPGKVSGLTVEVLGPERATPGEAVSCVIVVRNPGPVVAAQARVELTPPPGVRLVRTEPPATAGNGRLEWELGNVEAGGERRLRLDLVAGEAGEWELTPAVRFVGIGLRGRVERPPLAVTLSAPAAARRGEVVTFLVQVHNQGEMPMPKVELHGRLSEGLGHSEGRNLETALESLVPGEVRTVRLEVAAGAAGLQTCAVEAVAGPLRSQARAEVRVAEAGLAVRLEAAERSAAGADFGCRLEVANASPEPAEGVRLTLRLPAELEAVAASTGGALDRAAPGVTWTLGNLGPGQVQSVTVQLRPRQDGDYPLRAVAGAVNRAEASQTGNVSVGVVPPGSNGAANGAQGGAAALAVRVTAGDDPLEVGAETAYEVRVVNGGGAAAHGVRLTVLTPDGLDLLAGTGPSGLREQTRQKAATEPLPELGPRAEAVYRFRVRGSKAGVGLFEAVVQADDVGEPARAQARCNVYADGAGAAAAPGR
jgi:hypothetical protein